MLTQPCFTLNGVGPALTAKLAQCGIYTLQDLLFHLPLRYQDRTRITPIRDLVINDSRVITGRVCKVEIKRGKKPMLYCYVEDQTGIVRLRFFSFNKHQIQQFNQHKTIYAFGEVKAFGHQLEMIHPEYQLLDADQVCTVDEHFTPIYPSTQGLSQTKLRVLVKEALSLCREELAKLEWLDTLQLQAYKLHALDEALQQLHHPAPDTPLAELEQGSHPALKRLILDELVAHRLSLGLAKQQRQALIAPAMPLDHQQQLLFLQNIPFSLTTAQQRVSQAIQVDLSQTKPMLRLVQGDVGSGKTVVAAMAAFQAMQQGFQVVLMAPTDLLSEQHVKTMQPWFEKSPFKILALRGKLTQKEKKQALQAIATKECQLIIGTHALFQDNVAFAKLGLVIIDEQHRFGVEQRAKLWQKGHTESWIPHQLLLTATPIPRTLAMSHFAHLDVSSIDELPPGRSPVITAVVNQNKREQIIERLKIAFLAKKQAYWVCTLVEESESLQCQAAIDSAMMLQSLLPEIKVGLVHGRMAPAEKDAIIMAFKQQDIALLVATTVIEVGIDVPNASLMIIENAERLGLSQLHQLRGRVGRGSQQSHCLLLYQSPLSANAKTRLEVMRETNDGFVVAEKDLQLRGAGELLGKRQAGYKAFKIANLARDQALLHDVATLTQQLLTQQPDLITAISQRWLSHADGLSHLNS